MSHKAKPSFIVRRLELKDCEEVRNIWTQLNFILAKYCNEVLIKVDPDGIFVAQDLQTGKLLGVCSGTNHTKDLAFIGQYAVLPQYQGLGIGSTLWKKVIEHIGPQRNTGLYAAKRMFENYRDRSGFVVVPERRCHYYMGKVSCDDLIKQINGITLYPINEYNVESVAKYDKEVCDGLDRTTVIKEYSKTLETISLTAIEDEINRVKGYCIITATNFNTAIVEPLYADNEQIAELLIGKCCDSLPTTKTNGLMFQCWDYNEKAISIANKIGLKLSDKEPILFTKQDIEGRVDKIFCVNNRVFCPF